MSGAVCGSTWRVTTCQPPAPSARERSTKRRSFTDSTCARRRRLLPAQLVTPMTTASVVADDPSTAASTMASGRNGMTRNQSSMAMSNRSTRPPTKPAVTPTAEPMTTATTVATTPMKRLMRAPQMSWARTLRPSSSVPSGNSALGGARSGLPRPAAAVSSRAGTRRGAARAMATNSTRTARPATPARSERNCRPKRAAVRRRLVQASCRTDGAGPPEPPAVVAVTGPPGGCGDRDSRTAGQPPGWPR